MEEKVGEKVGNIWKTGAQKVGKKVFYNNVEKEVKKRVKKIAEIK